MNITYDPDKNERNIRERGLSFEKAADFDFDTALFWRDSRHDYGEDRIISLGLLDGRVHALVFKRVDVDCIPSNQFPQGEQTGGKTL